MLFPRMNARGSLFYFSPDSRVWIINRELVILLAGARAAILQIAHPTVAYGVAAHSNFQYDGYGRLLRTLEAVYTIIFGTREEADRMARLVHGMHSKVRGDTPHPYDAFSQDAQMWVLATLIVPALEMYERFVGPVPSEWLPRYYAELRFFGKFFGLDPQYGPQTWDDFRAYYGSMIKGDLLASDPLSVKLAHAIVRPNGPFLFRLGTRPLRFLVEELLESPVREKLQFRSRASGRLAIRTLDFLLPRLLPVFPDKWRYAPKYLAARRLLAEEDNANRFPSSHRYKTHLVANPK